MPLFSYLFVLSPILLICKLSQCKIVDIWFDIQLPSLSAVCFCWLTFGILTRKFFFFFWQTPALNVITEYIIGYLYPGYPVANICFKVYGYISMKQGITFLQDFKLGHYMKIPPRAMFIAQVHFPPILPC